MFEKLEELSNQFNIYCNSRPEQLYRPKQGEMCLSKFSAGKLNGISKTENHLLLILCFVLFCIVLHSISKELSYNSCINTGVTFIRVSSVQFQCL